MAVSGGSRLADHLSSEQFKKNEGTGRKPKWKPGNLLCESWANRRRDI